MSVHPRTLAHPSWVSNPARFSHRSTWDMYKDVHWSVVYGGENLGVYHWDNGQCSGKFPPRTARHQWGTIDWVHSALWMDLNTVPRRKKERRMRYLTPDHFCKLFAHKTLHRDTREHKDTSEELLMWKEGTEVGTREKGLEKLNKRGTHWDDGRKWCLSNWRLWWAQPSAPEFS